jgi:nitrite reductase/ring-hydroxylating ferredoxin subunit
MAKLATEVVTAKCEEGMAELKRTLLQRVFGIPATPEPTEPGCWGHAGGCITVDLDRAPELDAPGGAVRLEGKGMGVRVLIVRGEDGAYRAFRNRCAHLGHRRLDLAPGAATLQCCSLGKSTYALDGRRISGPASGGLTSFRSAQEGRRLIVYLE